MNLTNNDFFKYLPTIKQAINKATFISIDCEMTGLKGDTIVNQFDTPSQFYEKMYYSSKDFLVLQFGLCIFRYVKSQKCWRHQTYNFWIFPRVSNRNVPDSLFSCQASSIDFLVKHNFDFNKLFREGIPYLNLSAEITYKMNLMNRHDNKIKQISNRGDQHNTNIISVPPDDKPFIDDIMNKIRQFLQTKDKELVLPQCNAFHRRLIYQSVECTFATSVAIEGRNVGNDRVLVISRPVSKGKMMEIESERLKKDLEELDTLVGFSTLIKILEKSQKLIVGHHMILDIMQIVDKFHNRLTKDYESFKTKVHSLFPQMLDTKHMSASGEFKDLIKSNALIQLVTKCSSEPFGVPKMEAESGMVSYTMSDAKEHEAGYDAFITGMCFISMWTYSAKKHNGDFESLALVEPYMNKLFLVRVQDEPFMCFGGPDGKLPSRDHVFYLKFPETWQTNDIVQLFSPFGNVFIAWIDSSSAYVALHKPGERDLVLRTLSQSDTYSIQTYQEHQQSIQHGTKTGKKRALESSGTDTNPIPKIASLEVHCGVSSNNAPTSPKVFEENISWE